MLPCGERPTPAVPVVPLPPRPLPPPSPLLTAPSACNRAPVSAAGGEGRKRARDGWVKVGGPRAGEPCSSAWFWAFENPAESSSKPCETSGRPTPLPPLALPLSRACCRRRAPRSTSPSLIRPQPARRATRSSWWCGAARSTHQSAATAGEAEAGPGRVRCRTLLAYAASQCSTLPHPAMLNLAAPRAAPQHQVRADDCGPEEGGGGQAGGAAGQAAGAMRWRGWMQPLSPDSCTALHCIPMHETGLLQLQDAFYFYPLHLSSSVRLTRMLPAPVASYCCPQLFWQDRELTPAFDGKTLLDLNLHTGFSLHVRPMHCSAQRSRVEGLSSAPVAAAARHARCTPSQRRHSTRPLSPPLLQPLLPPPPRCRAMTCL